MTQQWFWLLIAFGIDAFLILTGLAILAYALKSKEET